MDKIDELLTRGVDKIYPSRQALEKVLRSGKKLKLYQGFDPTGTLLHLGHMVALRKHRQWQDLGHQVIFLIGDGTGQAGDPSGRMHAREKFLSQQELRQNARDYIHQASKIVRFAGPNPVQVLYNADWLNQLRLPDILGIAGHFTVQQLIERDMYQARIKAGESINLREFLYPLLQGYDSVAMEVDLEMGGTDQTFNMLAGRMLAKAMLNKEKFVMTTPLLSDSKGVKIGKSEDNVIPLSGTEPADLFGKIMALGDDTIVPLFTLLTDMPMTEISQIKPGIESKKRVAKLIVAQLHSPAAADEAQKQFESTFQEGQLPSDIPTFALEKPQPLVDVLVATNLAKSKSAARRLIEQRAVEIEGMKVNSITYTLDPSPCIIKVGPRKFIKISHQG